MFINRGLSRPLSKKFDKVFKQNLFRGDSSKSGSGSSVQQTNQIAKLLPGIIADLGINSVLDIPCGDLEWMSQVNLTDVRYIGGDVAPTLIRHLKYQFPDREFRNIDISKDPLPRVDLIFCRDLFVHLSNKVIKASLKNIKTSQSKYLATTTFKNRARNKDLPLISKGIAWRTINLERPPFKFPTPILFIDEKCTEGNGLYEDKVIAIWKIEDLP